MRNFLKIGATVWGLVLLLSCNFPMAMAVFTATSLAGGSLGTGVLAATVTTCELTEITSSDACKIRGGLKTVYWAQYSEIDWASMAADPLSFDATNQEILSYIMLGGAVFHKLTFDRKQGFYDFTYTADSDLYEQVITMIFEGKSRDIRNALCNAVGCCKIVIHIIDNNCLERVVGVEWDGATFEPQVTTLRVGRHLDSSGQFGTSRARDELDLIGESICPPLFAAVGETAIPV